MFARTSLCFAAWGAAVVAADLAPRQTFTPVTTAAATAITSCHLHASDLYRTAGATEYHVDAKITAASEVPAQYTDCHAHGSDMFCVDSERQDVAVYAEGSETANHDYEGENHDHENEEEHATDSAGGHKRCHFHAGVEHCTSDEVDSEAVTCEAPQRDYNIRLRVGLLFVILATSAIGVFGPIFLHKVMPTKLNTFFIVLKQFGTGIIVSTAFVHLYTHAALMFGNKCLGELGYEATTSAVLMAGLFLSFVVEYAGHRAVNSKVKAVEALSQTEKSKAALSTEVVGILVMEAGIIFHSLLIGLTLVVAGDEVFVTLFVVILFHQMFEGMALGSRIATIGTRIQHPIVRSERSSQDTPSEGSKSADTSTTQPTSSEEDLSSSISFPTKKKLALAALFAFITPIGMAIGIGVLQHFKGNDKSTIIAIGTLDALSAGILVWVGLVEMWAAEWMVGSHDHPAELTDAPLITVISAGFGLVAGLVLMSLLGKWA